MVKNQPVYSTVFPALQSSYTKPPATQPPISSNPVSADRTVINDYAVWVIKCLLIHNPQSSVS